MVTKTEKMTGDTKALLPRTRDDSSDEEENPTVPPMKGTLSTFTCTVGNDNGVR